MMTSTPASRSLRVLVAHALPVVRAGLAATLARTPDLQVQEAMPLAAHGLDVAPPRPAGADVAPHVVVLDYADGLRWAEARRRRSTTADGTPEVMVLTAQVGEWEIRRALHHGVLGIHLLGTPLERLAAGVRLVAAGRRSFDDLVVAKLADGLSLPPLTPRENAVLALLAEGACNKEIARQLSIALGTVKAHMRTLLDKLQVESRVQAVVVARERGIVGSAVIGCVPA